MNISKWDNKPIYKLNILAADNIPDKPQTGLELKRHGKTLRLSNFAFHLLFISKLYGITIIVMTNHRSRSLKTVCTYIAIEGNHDKSGYAHLCMFTFRVFKYEKQAVCELCSLRCTLHVISKLFKQVDFQMQHTNLMKHSVVNHKRLSPTSH